ncbi:MAG: nitroreductase family protein [Acidobacteria bacterium]|nr:nitroreductase family protein [Acidobacteriota bacterium]
MIWRCLLEKIRPVDYDIHDLLRRRWSPRAFSDRTIEPAVMRRIFEAARWSASCFNEQPWRFIVGIRGAGDTYDRITAALSPGNQRWTHTAPVLVLICSKKTFTHNSKPNDWHVYDAGQAAAHLTVQAMSESVFVHQMAGFSADKARELFQVPADYEVVTAMAMGYAGDPAQLPEELHKSELSPGSRRPLSGSVFGEEWDTPPSFLDS